MRRQVTNHVCLRACFRVAIGGPLLLTLALGAGCQQGIPVGLPVQRPGPTATQVPSVKARPVTVKFADVTKRAGIIFRHQACKTPRKYLIETMGGGGAFLDADGDGWLDILLLNGAPLPGAHVAGRPTMRLYHNNHDGTFRDVTHSAGLDKSLLYAMGVAVGDYDNDGRDDFYVTCALGGGHLFHNEGSGRFRDVTSQAGLSDKGRWGTSCAWVDYDRDGKLDLFVCHYVRYGSLDDDQPCYAEAHRPIYCIPSAYEPSQCALYRNVGGGKFADVSVASGIAGARGKSLGIAVWDYDGDGWPDIFVANDTVPGFLFHNERNGTFKEVGIETGVAFGDGGIAHSGMGIDADDVFNDGSVCLAISNYQGVHTSFYQCNAEGLFREIQRPTQIGPATGGVLGFGLAFLDVDNDGLKDLIQVNGHVQDDIEMREPGTPRAQPTLLFHNRGDHTFEEVGAKSGAPFAARLVARGCCRGDFDNDGRVDVLITCNDGPALLWRNETAVANHWISLHLVGVQSNRDGIGALVTARTGNVTQRTQVRSGSGYLGANDLRPHFGLGAFQTADIEIRWPSGKVETIKGLAADRFYTMREGEGKAR